MTLSWVVMSCASHTMQTIKGRLSKDKLSSSRIYNSCCLQYPVSTMWASHPQDLQSRCYDKGLVAMYNLLEVTMQI